MKSMAHTCTSKCYQGHGVAHRLSCHGVVCARESMAEEQTSSAVVYNQMQVCQERKTAIGSRLLV
jgi:hypothetical protein